MSRTPLRKAAAGTLIAVLAVVVLAADQLSKYLALQFLPEREAVPILGDFLQFYLTFNPGAAFSLGEGVTWVFTLALALVAAAIVYLAATRVQSRLWAVVLGLLLGGVLGNLTDRIIQPPGFPVGHVVDFILTPWMWFWTNPAIYNVADMFIVTMMIGVAILVLTGLRLDGTRESRAEADESGTDDDDAIARDDAVSRDDAVAPDDAVARDDAVAPDDGAERRPDEGAR